MKYAPFAPLNRDLSRLVLGSMVFHPDTLDNTYELLDAWKELGGNIVDTAHLYQGGNSERAFGRWLEDRGVRDEMVILTKGAHHNADRRRVTPEDITCDLRDSLARLRTDSVELYILHRDDPRVPVGEIVDALNRHYEAGRIKSFGGSNWTPERLDAANAYAASHGLQGFTSSSPHLSLAVPNGEIWDGCVDARSPDALAWHRERQMPLFAWSSQARGFFSGLYTPQNVAENEFMARVYDSPRNWERYRRAEQLGAERGFNTIEVALAWVLQQPFPVFPLIGPATVQELRSSVRALELELSPEDVTWLGDPQSLHHQNRDRQGAPSH
ncbi:MAG: aldo/keto reductase [Actinomycetota bacterium]